MKRRRKVGRNDPCPCGQGRSYRKCCEPTTDWNKIIRAGENRVPYLSIRGRNSLFAHKIAEVLQLDSIESFQSVVDYKSAFTAKAVEGIHQAIVEVWPLDTDISKVLSKNSSEVSGLYVGDYGTEYLKKGIVRHSTYSQKMLVIDPFQYPTSFTDEYNPILNPEMYRAQTLKNVNCWFSLLPWIDEGVVEVIRTPADFDRKLQLDLLAKQEKKFKDNPELKKAIEESSAEGLERHSENFHLQQILMSSPRDILEQYYEEEGLGKNGISKEEFVSYIQERRDKNPDVLSSSDNEVDNQMHMFSSGAAYNLALITANLSNSFLVTDIHSKWKEIEFDRGNSNAASEAWSSFAKAF